MPKTKKCRKCGKEFTQYKTTDKCPSQECKKAKRAKVREKFGTTASTSTLKKQADRAMSDYIRERDHWKCCTCPDSGKHIQNGHYIPRQTLALRYDETNCHAQCPSCNGKHNIDREPYRQFIIRKYGEDKIKEFSEKSRILTNGTKLYYIEKKNYFTNLKNGLNN